MCLLFVTVDLGRPDRMWHLIPGIGRFHFPISMLSWDVLVLNGYLLLNLHIPGYSLYQRYLGRPAQTKYYMPFVYLSVAWAISIHTVTAFLYTGLAGRPFWNAAILAPRFIASAFTAGPAFIILVLQIVRSQTTFSVKDETIEFLRMVVLVCGLINLFLLGSEVFTEFYADSSHVVSARYLYFGLGGHHALVPWIWTSVIMNVGAIVMLLTRRFEQRGLFLTNLPLVLLIVGIWIEKGMGLIVPGFIPTPLGEVFEYLPSKIETLVCLGIWGIGLLVMTLLIKFATDVETGVISAAKGVCGNFLVVDRVAPIAHDAFEDDAALGGNRRRHRPVAGDVAADCPDERAGDGLEDRPAFRAIKTITPVNAVRPPMSETAWRRYGSSGADFKSAPAFGAIKRTTHERGPTRQRTHRNRHRNSATAIRPPCPKRSATLVRPLSTGHHIAGQAFGILCADEVERRSRSAMAASPPAHRKAVMAVGAGGHAVAFASRWAAGSCRIAPESSNNLCGRRYQASSGA